MDPVPPFPFAILNQNCRMIVSETAARASNVNMVRNRDPQPRDMITALEPCSGGWAEEVEIAFREQAIRHYNIADHIFPEVEEGFGFPRTVHKRMVLEYGLEVHKIYLTTRDNSNHRLTLAGFAHGLTKLKAVEELVMTVHVRERSEDDFVTVSTRRHDRFIDDLTDKILENLQAPNSLKEFSIRFGKFKGTRMKRKDDGSWPSLREVRRSERIRRGTQAVRGKRFHDLDKAVPGWKYFHFHFQIHQGERLTRARFPVWLQWALNTCRCY